MCKLKCELVEDMLPLYVEDLVSDTTKEEIKAHLDGCEKCREHFENLSRELEDNIKDEVLEDLNSEDLKKNTLGQISVYLNKIRYIFTIFSMAVAALISISGGGFFSTIPWIIIVPFILGLFYEQKLLVLATPFITSVLFELITNGLLEIDYLFTGSARGIYFSINAAIGLFLAYSIKGLKK